MPKVKDLPTLYVGVDPGGSGGIATISGKKVGLVSMPDGLTELWSLFETLSRQARVFAVVEQVGGYMPGSGGNVGSRMFTFGRSYGSLLMALTAARIPYETVVPRTWQKKLGVPPRRTGKRENQTEESKAEFKRRLKAKASQLFPSEKVTLATCDALLLAEYCRRIRHERGD